MEEALDDTPMFGGFAGLDIGQDALPDETTILRLRHLLERHDLVRKILDVVQALLQQLERIKASIRAKAEHPLHIVKNLLGYRKTHDRLPAKNTAQRMTLFALAHVWLAHKRLLNMVPQG
ncbi:hypothetical protein Tther_02585 [Tepidimonas thermarum]|uniref:Uncharacterized protein n=1 Tax=Tepidimonas thermarum TaxID=335431 RepID=A0A554WQV8_9BURK|nr:hypothetical protein Tther_02585 [Tepidimonas thermarum]